MLTEKIKWALTVTAAIAVIIVIDVIGFGIIASIFWN